MNNEKSAELYGLYLSSIEDGRVDEVTSESMDIMSSWFDGPSTSNAEDAVLGSIRAVSVDGYEIHCLILEQAQDGLYSAAKTSSFTCFATAHDYIATGRFGQVLVEMDNEFRLGPAEVLGRPGVDVLSLIELMEVLRAREEYVAKGLSTPLDLDPFSYKAMFRIKEHELTLLLRSRSRDEDHRLWVPQLELADAFQPIAVNYLAASETLAAAFGMLVQPKDCKVFYTPTHSLYKTESGSVVLLPAPELVGKNCEVHCGAFRVFRGYLPKTLVLGMGPAISLPDLQEYLDIRIEPR